MELLAIFPSEKNIEENQKYIYIYMCLILTQFIYLNGLYFKDGETKVKKIIYFVWD